MRMVDRVGLGWPSVCVSRESGVLFEVMTGQEALIQRLFSQENTSLREAMSMVYLADGEVVFRRGGRGDAFHVIEY